MSSIPKANFVYVITWLWSLLNIYSALYVFSTRNSCNRNFYKSKINTFQRRQKRDSFIGNYNKTHFIQWIVRGNERENRYVCLNFPLWKHSPLNSMPWLAIVSCDTALDCTDRFILLTQFPYFLSLPSHISLTHCRLPFHWELGWKGVKAKCREADPILSCGWKNTLVSIQHTHVSERWRHCVPISSSPENILHVAFPQIHSHHCLGKNIFRRFVCRCRWWWVLVRWIFIHWWWWLFTCSEESIFSST